MATTISLRDANQNFAKYVRNVAGGAEYVITRRGEPVARLAPVRPAARVLTAEQIAALARIRASARRGWTLGRRRFRRDEAHER